MQQHEPKQPWPRPPCGVGFVDTPLAVSKSSYVFEHGDVGTPERASQQGLQGMLHVERSPNDSSFESKGCHSDAQNEALRLGRCASGRLSLGGIVDQLPLGKLMYSPREKGSEPRALAEALTGSPRDAAHHRTLPPGVWQMAHQVSGEQQIAKLEASFPRYLEPLRSGEGHKSAHGGQ
jgi:hypothetical protein